VSEDAGIEPKDSCDFGIGCQTPVGYISSPKLGYISSPIHISSHAYLGEIGQVGAALAHHIVLDDHLAVAAHLGGPVKDGLEVQGRTVPPAVAFHAKHRPLGGPVLLQPLAGRFYLQEFGEAP
jgi:hypothetical protein